MTKMKTQMSKFTCKQTSSVLVLGFVLFSVAEWSTAQQANNPCPALNTEVEEHTGAGQVLFSFQSQAISITITPRDTGTNATQGLLQLVAPAHGSYQVQLATELDLTQLNPRPPPIPQTTEELNCTYDDSEEPWNQNSVQRAVEYIMKCEVSVAGSSSPVQVESTIRVAIRDRNDLAPYFMCAPYYKQISELTPVSTTIFSLEGLAADLDIDGGISGYSLQDDGQGVFSMLGAASQGLIVVTGPLDYDHGPRTFALNISVTDIGEPSLQGWTYLYIQLTDGDDLNPVFSHDSYHLALPEYDPRIIGEDFPTMPAIQAWDQDTGIQAQLVFTFTSGHVYNGETYFTINNETGQIIPLKMLDRKSKDEFIISVKVHQADAASTRYSQSIVVITVEDNNVHAPVMLSLPVNVSVPENAGMGYYVTQILAQDDDLGRNSELEYQLDGDPVSLSTFMIHPQTGVVSVSQDYTIDRETRDIYHLQGFAREKQTPERWQSDNVSITVVISDVNDNTPTFMPSDRYVFTVNASSIVPQAAVVLGQLQTVDADIGRNSNVSVAITAGDDSGMFSLDSSSGRLSVSSPASPTVPLQHTYWLTVRATDGGQPPLSSTAHVTVRVEHINLNGPRFSQEEYVYQVREDVAVHFPVGTVLATDTDAESRLLYQLVASAHTSYFNISAESGTMFVIKQLDREKLSHHYLNVSVTDGTYSDYAVVTVQVTDVNDNVPEFLYSDYRLGINVSTPVGTAVLRVRADDVDSGNNGLVTHSLHGSQGHFEVMPLTGDIYVTSSLSVGCYNMVTTARDYGQPVLSASSSVTICATNLTNEHAPTFEEFVHSAVIPENFPLDQDILSIKVADKDEGVPGYVSVYITKGNLGNHFYIDSNNILKLQSGVDYESKRYYELEITATDMGVLPKQSRTTAYVTLTDVNDNAPVFLPLPTYIIKQGPIAQNEIIIKVLAYDADSSVNQHNVVEYTIISNSPQFNIDRSSGAITSTAVLNPDNYTLTLQAKNPNSTLHSNFTLDVYIVSRTDTSFPVSRQVQHVTYFNESHPVPFVLYDAGVSVGGQAQDVGVIYGLVAATEGLKNFTLNAQSGTVVMHSPLDRERSGTESLVMSAQSQHGGPLTLISVVVRVMDSNDCVPHFPFTQYTATVPENAGIGHVVLTLKAEDNDAVSQLLYFSLQGLPDVFTLYHYQDVATITVSAPLDLDTMDPSLSGVYSFMVFATDGLHTGAPAKVMVKVTDINDNTPQFNQTEYSVSVLESHTPCESVLPVYATDADPMDKDLLHYEIVDGNEAGLFEIGLKTGVISLSCDEDKHLDRETHDQYDLVVRVKDSAENEVNVNVQIQILDVNDEAPKFFGEPYLAYTMEGAESLTLELPVSVMDRDEGVNGQVRLQLSGPVSHHFYIREIIHGNVTVGMLGVSLPLDREGPGLVLTDTLTALYNLTVTAVDYGSPAHSTSTLVTVTVYDVNDNPPVFTSPVYEVTVEENLDIGTSVVTVTTTDADLPSTSNITYSILNGDPYGLFAIEDNGALFIASIFNESMEFQYNLTIQSYDGKFTALTNVEVIIRAVNDHAPEFSQDTYQFFVYETHGTTNSSYQRHLVGRVIATDPDGDVVSYSLKEHAGNSRMFSLNSSTGEIVVSGELDRESQTHFTLTVSASDKGIPVQNGQCTVEIEVLDVNDKEPVFVNQPYIGSVHEHSLPGTQVRMIQGFIQTEDDDVGVNADVKYSIAGNGSELFTIDPNNGTISVAMVTRQWQLDRETQDTYIFQVTAENKDSFNSSHTVTAPVTIYLEDTNDHAPGFLSPHYNLTVTESLGAGSWVGRVQAQDRDLPPNNAVIYKLEQGADGHFYIDAWTGDLYTTGGLDREVTDLYNITVSATDPGYTLGSKVTYGTVEVHIDDVNDNAPHLRMEEFHFSVRENSEANVSIGAVKASDPDLGLAGDVTYMLLGNVPFIVNTTSGEVTVIEVLDREQVPDYSFIIQAVDRGAPPLTSTAYITVHIVDENDNSPQFSEPEYTAYIVEQAPVDSVVFYTTATDQDFGVNSEISYYLEAVNGSDGYFNVHYTKGLVTVARPVDKEGLISQGVLLENNTTMLMRLVATDHGSPARYGHTLLRIVITDVAHDTFQFMSNAYTVTIPEEVPRGTPVLALQVESSAPLGNVTFSVIGTPFFHVPSSSQGLVMTSGVRLNRERQDTHVFTVQASDSRQPPRTSIALVTVKLSDLNDNPPHFSHVPLYWSLEEGTYLTSHVLGFVEASDLDDGLNQQLVYSLDNGQYEKASFFLNETTGELSVRGLVDWSDAQSYVLTVNVTDEGSPALTSSTLVQVSVIDLNNHAPVFVSVPSYLNISEATAPGTMLLEFSAEDGDDGLNGTVFYDILVEEDNPLPFYVKNTDEKGCLNLATTLNHEYPHTYNLTLLAYDLGVPLRQTSTAYLTVHINDPDQTFPRFAQKNYEVRVPYTLDVGSEIVDLEVGSSGMRYNFRFIDGNSNETFTINDYGCVTLRKPLSHKDSSHELFVMVQDWMSPPNMDFTKVYITVTENQTSSLFGDVRRDYEAVLPENVPPPVFLLDLNSTAESSGAPVEYYLVNEELHDIFRIDNQTGYLWCLQSLDRESRDSYQVKVGLREVKAQVSAMQVQNAQVLDTVQVHVQVQDLNDNTPVFPKDPLVYGMPVDAQFGYKIGTIQAEDGDTGNHSVLVYTVSGELDAENFYLDPLQGDLYSKGGLVTLNRAKYGFSVTATDNDGYGLSALVNVLVYVLRDDQRALIVADLPPTVFVMYQQRLILGLSAILGWTVHLERLEVHKDMNDGTDSLDLTRTDMYFYAVDDDTDSIVYRTEILDRADEKSEEIRALFSLYHVDSLQAVRHGGHTLPLNHAEISLVVLACFILVVAIVAICVLLITWKKKELFQEEEDAEFYASFREDTKGIDNPVFADSMDLYTHNFPPPGSRQPHMFKPMETQRLSLYLPAESDTSSCHEESVHLADFSTFHDGRQGGGQTTRGSTAPPDHRPYMVTSGKFHHAPWARPFSAADIDVTSKRQHLHSTTFSLNPDDSPLSNKVATSLSSDTQSTEFSRPPQSSTSTSTRGKSAVSADMRRSTAAMKYELDDDALAYQPTDSSMCDLAMVDTDGIMTVLPGAVMPSQQQVDQERRSMTSMHVASRPSTATRTSSPHPELANVFINPVYSGSKPSSASHFVERRCSEAGSTEPLLVEVVSRKKGPGSGKVKPEFAICTGNLHTEGLGTVDGNNDVKVTEQTATVAKVPDEVRVKVSSKPEVTSGGGTGIKRPKRQPYRIVPSKKTSKPATKKSKETKLPLKFKNTEL